MLSTNQLCSPRNGIWTFHASWLETFRDFDTLWLFLVWLSLIVHLMESPFNSKGFPIWRYHPYHGLRHFEIVRRWHFAVVTHSTTWSFRVTLRCFRVFSGPTKLPLGHFRSYKVAWGKYMRWPGWFTLGLNYRLGGITVHHQNQTGAPVFKVFILVWVCLYQICKWQLSKKMPSQFTEAKLIILNVASTLYILLKLHLNCPSLKSYKNQEIDQEPVSIILYKNVAKTYEEL